MLLSLCELLVGDNALPNQALWALTCVKYLLFAAYSLEIAAALGGVADSQLVQASHYFSFVNLARADVNQGPGLFYVLFLAASAWVLLISSALAVTLWAASRGM
mgnify:CR=1 FL=1